MKLDLDEKRNKNRLDEKIAKPQTSILKFLQYMEYDEITNENQTVPVITVGCYNWTSSSPKPLGCYSMLDQPMSDKKNGLVCLCQKDFCNMNQLINNTTPISANSFTCVFSSENQTSGFSGTQIPGSSGSSGSQTCQGYACITRYILRLGQSLTVERKCQNVYQNVDKLEVQQIIQNQQQNFLVWTTEFDGTSAANVLESYCYSNFCNSPNMENSPTQLLPPGFVDPSNLNINYNCRSEICNSMGCTGISQNSNCKSQFCYTGKNFGNK